MQVKTPFSEKTLFFSEKTVLLLFGGSWCRGARPCEDQFLVKLLGCLVLWCIVSLNMSRSAMEKTIQDYSDSRCSSRMLFSMLHSSGESYKGFSTDVKAFTGRRRYSAGSKETLIYRREQGKALDAWVEGLDMANQEHLGEDREQIACLFDSSRSPAR